MLSQDVHYLLNVIRLTACHIYSDHDPRIMMIALKYMVSFQTRKLTKQLMGTVDRITSTMINLMVPGNRTIVIKTGDTVMVLKKGLYYINGRQTFNLPPSHGDKSGVSMTIQGPVMESDDCDTQGNFGLGVSDHTYFLCCVFLMKIIVIQSAM